MTLDVISILLYICTFLVGLYRGIKYSKISNNKLFVIWIFVFLCWGYMTGSDWRSYENDYYGDLYPWQYITEPLSLLVFTYVPNIISDFWLFLGLSKCLYLATVFYFYNKITNNPLAAVACAIPMFLVSLLIDNPLRYMFAMIPLTIAIAVGVESVDKGFTKKRIFRMVVFILLASMFHNSCFIFLIIFPLAFRFRNISKLSRVAIFVAFLILVVITSDVSLINSVKQLYVSTFSIFGEVKEYSGYDAVDNSSVFSIGNLFKIVLLGIVLYTRGKVVGSSKYSELFYSFSIFYFFIDRFTILIESGYRLTMPFMYFYSLYVINLLKMKVRIGRFVLVYMVLSFVMTMWSTFVLIPYSNSIPYILTGHKSYNERYYNNFDAQRARTGIDSSYEITK